MNDPKRKFDLEKIKKNIDELIGVAEPIRKSREEKALEKNYDSLEETYDSIIGKIIDKEIDQATKNFFAIIESFTNDELVEILSVMFAGRDFVIHGKSDRFVPIREQFNSLYQDKEYCEGILYEKFKLIEYLQAGMKYYKI